MVRVSYNISSHDLQTKKNQIDKFLAKGQGVKVQLRTFGRGKYLYKDALDKLKGMFSEYKIVNAWAKKNNNYIYLK